MLRSDVTCVRGQDIHSANLPVRFKLTGVCLASCDDSLPAAARVLATAVNVCGQLPMRLWNEHDIADCTDQLATVLAKMEQGNKQAVEDSIKQLLHPAHSLEEFAVLGLLAENLLSCYSANHALSLPCLDAVRRISGALQASTSSSLHGYGLLIHAKYQWAVQSSADSDDGPSQSWEDVLESFENAKAHFDDRRTNSPDAADASQGMPLAAAMSAESSFWLAVVEVERAHPSLQRALERLVDAVSEWELWWNCTLAVSKDSSKQDPEIAWLQFRKPHILAGIRAAAQLAECCGFGDTQIQLRALVSSIDGTGSSHAGLCSSGVSAIVEFSNALQVVGLRSHSSRLMGDVAERLRSAGKVASALQASISRAAAEVHRVDLNDSDSPSTMYEDVHHLAKEVLADDKTPTANTDLLVAECESALAMMHHESGNTHTALLAAVSSLTRCQRLIDRTVSGVRQDGGVIAIEAAHDVKNQRSTRHWRILRLYVRNIAHVAQLWEHLGDARSARKYYKVALDFTAKVRMGAGHRFFLSSLACLDSAMGILAKGESAKPVQGNAAAEAAAVASRGEKGPRQPWLEQLLRADAADEADPLMSQKLPDLHSLRMVLKVAERSTSQIAATLDSGAAQHETVIEHIVPMAANGGATETVLNVIQEKLDKAEQTISRLLAERKIPSASDTRECTQSPDDFRRERSVALLLKVF